eukprot:6197091-Pleurochrysis_carterae.AAC.2
MLQRIVEFAPTCYSQMLSSSRREGKGSSFIFVWRIRQNSRVADGRVVLRFVAADSRPNITVSHGLFLRAKLRLESIVVHAEFFDCWGVCDHFTASWPGLVEDLLVGCRPFGALAVVGALVGAVERKEVLMHSHALLVHSVHSNLWQMFTGTSTGINCTHVC